ncbi:MAG: RDD family protein [Micromonosporaceae bacterium]
MAPPRSPVPYAGLVSRLAALSLDVVVLTVAGLATSSLPGLAWEQVLGEPPGWLTAGAGLVAAALPVTYFTLAWWLTGQTVGDLLLGLVVRHRDGGRTSLPQAFLRAFFGLLIAPIWLVGLIGVLRDERRRAWHDRLFRTVVPYAPTSAARTATGSR